MVHMTQLPSDLLNAILVLVATPGDGARDLAMATTICKTLKEHARQPTVLRAVNFQRLTFTTEDFKRHRNRKGLLCLCARAGNQAARTILGKALLVQDPWFWGVIYGDKLLPHYWNIAPSEALHHDKLVRTFVLNATSKDIATMGPLLVNYVMAYAGYKATRACGIIYAIYDMCSYGSSRLRGTRIRSSQLRFGSFESVVVWVEKPYEDPLNRDNVIVLFDKLFPSARD